MKKISTAVNWIKDNGLFPDVPIVESAHAPEVIVNGKKVLLFATNNYLDMMRDERVVKAAEEGLRKWGIGNGSARLLTGNLDFHHLLESKIARFKEREAGLTFVAGYMANLGAIPALANIFEPANLIFSLGKIEKNRDTVIFSDEYNHASIIAGIRMSKCKKEIYRHCDMDDLEERLKQYPLSVRKIIITDGVFSMDGDIAPLPEVLELAKRYGAMTYVDDAHATGILGKNGRGVEDYFNVEGQTDVVMGTFTKAFGGVGGFIVGSQTIVDYLKIQADSYIFTAPIAPPVAYGLIKAIELVAEETWRRERILSNAAYFREKLSEAGINFLNSQTQIIPIFIGDEKKAILASERLLEQNIFVPAARWPAVPSGKARLRVTITSSHTKDQIDHFLEHLKVIKKDLKF